MSSTTPSDGWCPFATKVTTTKFWPGNQGFRAVVLHIAQGGYDAAVSWLSNDQSNPNSSAHFVIAKDGRIAQLVSINDSAWANGLRWQNGQWYAPGSTTRVENPSWVDIVPGVNPNLYTISIEHEGYYTEQWTPEMYAANTRLLKWIATQLGQPQGQPIQYVPHRNLIGHYEIDPLDRTNCPGPNVNWTQIAADANSSALLGQVITQSSAQHVYGTTALVSLPGYAIVTQLTEIDVPVAGYLDFQGTRWYISQYSYQNQISNFFDSASTVKPVQDLTASLCLNPGYRDAVTPGTDEFRALSPSWVRVLLFSQYQNFQTGQNSELDWFLNRVQGLGIKVVVLLNTESVGQVPPAHGSPDWSSYNARTADLAQKVASFYGNRIGAVEIFNEPDVQGVAPGDYGALLAACYPKVKAVSNVPVLSAGILCGTNLDAALNYLRSVVQVARGFYDGTGWHVYTGRIDGYPAANWGNFELRNALSSARAISGKPLWISEIGAQLDWTWSAGLAPADAVAAYLTRAYTLMRALGRNVVAQAFWFTWRIAGESWGIVDDAGNRRPAWYAFQQAASTTVIPVGAPSITKVTMTPTTFEAGQLLNVSITVRNNSNVTLNTQGPDPGYVYAEGEDFRSRGFVEQPNLYRVGIDLDGRTGVDHPYRWGLGAPLAPGATVTITGAIRLNSVGARNFWAGLVQESVAWVQDQQGTQRITVIPPSQVPVGTVPVITSVNLSPTTLNVGDLINVSVTVRNDSTVTLNTQGPNPGFVYNEGEDFRARGFTEQSGAFRVGIDFDGRAGVDHPYRWGLGAPLAPGQTVVVNGAIRLGTAQRKNYWAGLVREQLVWLQDNQGVQTVTVNAGPPPPPPPPPPGKPTITAVTFSPTGLSQGQLLQVSVTIKNGSNAPLLTQGPNPGFVYNEGDNYLTKQNPPVNGAYRIGIDFSGRSGVDHPYRWGFGSSLAPGKSLTVTGYVRLNRRQTTSFWIGLIQEGTGTLQDQQGTTAINVEKA